MICGSELLTTYPDDLFDNPGIDKFGERIWWVLHVRPRQEKQLVVYLQSKRVPFYLPLVPRRWRLRKRLMTSQVPLFPGYLFLLGNRDERIVALSSHRVVRALDVTDQDRLRRDLIQTKQLITTGVPVTSEDCLVPGTPVEIATGPLAGLKGQIVSTANGRRFIVRVDFIQRGASVQIDGESLIPIDPTTIQL